jgi:hypothetical protein
VIRAGLDADSSSPAAARIVSTAGPATTCSRRPAMTGPRTTCRAAPDATPAMYAPRTPPFDVSRSLFTRWCRVRAEKWRRRPADGCQGRGAVVMLLLICTRSSSVSSPAINQRLTWFPSELRSYSCIIDAREQQTVLSEPVRCHRRAEELEDPLRARLPPRSAVTASLSRRLPREHQSTNHPRGRP